MTELTLTGRSPLNRNLHLRLARGHRLYVSLYHALDAGPVRMLASASAEMDGCYLERGTSDMSSLWVGNCAFDLTEREADEISATYSQLRVEQSEPHESFEQEHA